MSSRVGAVARLLFFDLAGSIVWFPVWWYTKGLLKVLLGVRAALEYRVRSYAFRIWIRNFFVPMYGQHDITGRLVSVVMRTVVILGRAIALFVEALVYALGIVLWAVAPVAFVVLALTSFTRGLSPRV
jgi:hypothetical protein